MLLLAFAFPEYSVTVLLYTAYKFTVVLLFHTLYAGVIFAAAVVTVYDAVLAVLSALYHNAAHQYVDKFVVLGAGALTAVILSVLYGLYLCSAVEFDTLFTP